MCEGLDRTTLECPMEPSKPVDHVVFKDGRPFAILNATPALAARTVAGLALAEPAIAWRFERV